MTDLWHSPLTAGSKQFRLLTILPDKRFEADIECLLRHSDLDWVPAPSYETISYVWGDPRRTEQLLLNGQKISVPASSIAALRRVRLPYTKRVVWLDAICINQQDEADRSHQVSMMGEIYLHGNSNLIYLGEMNIDRALLSVSAIIEDAETEPNSFSHMRNEAGGWQYASTAIGAQFDSEALVKLFSLAWFRRLWVLQEAALAKSNTCFCGSAVVDLIQLTRAAAWLVYKYYFVDAKLRLQCSYAADMNDLIDDTYGYHKSKGGQPASVLYLLDLAQQRLSSIPVDKIYGLLGLMTHNDPDSQLYIRPDYSRSVADVYRQAAWAVIRSSGDLQILDYVRHWTRDGELQLDGFASWTPKWHRPKDMEEHANFMSLTFDACLGRKAWLPDQSQTQNNDPEVLAVKGIRVDTIARSNERIKCDEAVKSTYIHAILRQAETIISNSRPECRDGLDQETELALAITMCAGVDSSYQPAGAELVQSYHIFRQVSAEDPTRVPSISECENIEERSPLVLASQFCEAMYNGCMNRKFFTTSKCHFGLGPYFLRERDEIVVLYGLRWPAVLRRIPGSEEPHFIFLGTAYCHEVMHGELVTENDKSNRNSVDVFHIW